MRLEVSNDVRLSKYMKVVKTWTAEPNYGPYDVVVLLGRIILM